MWAWGPKHLKGNVKTTMFGRKHKYSNKIEITVSVYKMGNSLRPNYVIVNNIWF
jgi:hypothetical protein